MNRSLTPEDLDLVLDNQHVAVPAVVKEALMTIDADLPMDYAAYSGDYCWVVSKQSVYAWDFKNQQDLILQNKKRVSCLRLPTSGFSYSTHHIYVYDKDKRVKDASAIAVSREGYARFWPDFTKDKHIDSSLGINHEIVQNLHLLDVGSDILPTVFVLVTTYGSVYSMAISPDGGCSTELVGTKEGQGISGKITSFFFGGAASSHSTHVNRSILYWREGEEFEDVDEESQDALLVTLGNTFLMAYDVSNKSSVWQIETKSLLGAHVSRHFQKRDKIRSPDVSVTALDAQQFRQGILLLVAGSYSGSNMLSIFLVHLEKLDYNVPKIGYFQEIEHSSDVAELFDPLREDTYLHCVRLRIPRETSLASSVYKTDGIFVIHPSYVQSIYLPDDLKNTGEKPLVKTHLIDSGKQLLGYGADNYFCYVMTGEARTAALRLLPKGFENYQTDDVNIFEVIANLPMPEGNPEGMDLYKAFVEFCDKDISKATTLAHSLSRLPSTDLLQLVHDFVWSVFEEIADYVDIDGQLREKKKFLDYFILFMKHSDTMSTTLTSSITNPRIGVEMNGTELFAELYERMQILGSVHQWKNENPEQADVLRHLGFQMAKDLRFRDDGQFLAQKFALLHLVPSCGVNLCRELLAKGVFKEISHRFEMLSYSADLLLVFANAINTNRQGPLPLPLPSDGSRWTNKMTDAYTDMCLLLVAQLNDDSFNPNEKLKFVQYVTKLLQFSYTESETKPDGHPVLRELYRMGEERLALELAELHKDFNIICRMCLEKGDDKALEHYKRAYTADNFENYYFNYLNRKEMYADLLDQKGENADKFIASLDHIRWRRELRQGMYSDAGKTLLMESEKQGNSLERKKLFASFAKLSYLCSDDAEMHEAEIDDINLTQHLIEYQESLPRNFIMRYHPEKFNSLLTTNELIQLIHWRLKDENRQPKDYLNALIFIAKLIRYSSEKSEYLDTRQLIWEAAVAEDRWEHIQERNFNTTTFSLVFYDVLEGEEELIAYTLPDCDALLIKTAIIRKQCPSSTEFIRYCIEQTKKDLEQ